MIFRIDVSALPGQVDPLGQSVRQQIIDLGSDVGEVRTSRIFLVDASLEAMEKICGQLLADPVTEHATANGAENDPGSRIEVHLKPGVMDPVAASTEMAIQDLGLKVGEVRTGRAFVLSRKLPKEELERIAARVLANGVIEDVHFDRFVPKQFAAGRAYSFALKHVPLRELTDERLVKLSREGHLFLSLAEMKAIQTYFRQQEREPTDIELETLAQTWSEHCVHKTLKSAVEVEERNADGKVISTRRYGNLIKETIFASTMELMKKSAKDFCLSVFEDNAGVVAFDEMDAVCFKVETHNHPSAIEPYGGSATGVGGVIRDILGTGLAARPIANTDVFCVASPNYAQKLPRGIIHPKRVLQQVVAGVRDYGNRMGIPTVNGAVYFDDRYLGNPLVFCGCVGLIPRDKIFKETKAGDAIVVMGGRTGRDGIHGATFSSAELTDSHADEFSHAVQIGNAITEKKTADVVLAARDLNLFSAITDCGAGGLSSAVGEMGDKLGAQVELEKVPLKYAGLRYDEIWISEAQERMVLAVGQENVAKVLALAESENVEATVIGHFGTEKAELVLRYEGHEVGRMSMHFIHKGIPMPTRKAVVGPVKKESVLRVGDVEQTLLGLLAHPNIASKQWIIRQYDHEVQGGSVVKPLVGPQTGPSDGAVIRPKLGSYRGVAIGCGLCPSIADPYEMTLAAIDEAIRNVVAVGADPERIAILDNFCWPSVDDEQTLGTLVRAAEACADGARAYGIPFISGKDSLHNQFTNSETGQVIRIPSTLLISAIGIVEDVRRCVTMDFKRPGNAIFLVEAAEQSLAGRARLHREMAKAIAKGQARSCHDCSDGGVLVAVAEMCIGGQLGAKVDVTEPFAEISARYVVESAAGLTVQGAKITRLGEVTEDSVLQIGRAIILVEKLTATWRGGLNL